jgi:DNA-binding transcriptional ArsR family regulator
VARRQSARSCESVTVIRIQLAPEAIDRVAVARSALTECLLSLRLLVKPTLHPVHQERTRALRRLPASMRRAFERLAFVFADDAPVFVASSASGSISFAAELDRLRSMPAGSARYQFTRALHARVLSPAQLERPTARRRILRTAAAREPAGGREQLELVLEQPDVFLAAFCDLIGAYFERSFRKEWERIEPLLAECAEDAQRRIGSDGLYAALPQLSARLRGDPSKREILVEAFVDEARELTGEEPLLLAPSFFAWPNILVSLDDGGWPKAIVYPAPFLADRELEPLPPADLQRLLRALGDNTRLIVLRLLAEQPRSTRELAPLVGVSEATLSRHLRVLAEAGAVSRRREGRFVLYALRQERLAQLEPGLLRYLRRHQDRPA